MKPSVEYSKRSDYRHWYYLALAIVGGWLIALLSPILTPFLISAILAYMGDPLCDWLEAHKVNRTLSVVTVFSAFLFMFMFLAVLVVPRLEGQISYLLEQFPGYMLWLRETVLPWVQKHLGLEGKLQDLSFLQRMLAEHWQQAGGFAKSALASVSRSGTALLAMLANLVLVPVLTFYLLRDWDHIVAGVRALLPRRFEPTAVRLATESDTMFGAFMRGQVLVMISLGIIYSTGLWLMGLKLGLLIGMFAGIVSFVPYLGLILGMILAGVAAVLQFQSADPLLWVALVFVVGQVVEGAVLTPKFVGDNIGMHPVAVIFAVMAGGHLFGFFGILMALPIAAVTMVWVRHVIGRYKASRLY